MNALCERFRRSKEFKTGKGYETFFLQRSKQHPICIFGGGELGKYICTWLLENEIRVDFFCDNNKALHGKEILGGIKCISFDELLRYKDDAYLIVGVGDRANNAAVNAQLKGFKYIMRNPLGLSTYWHQTFDIDEAEFVNSAQNVLRCVSDPFSKEVYEFLLNLRLQDDVVDHPLDILDRYYCKDQYIVEDIIDYKTIKTCVDCGAYEGDTLEDLIRRGIGVEYHCFEMNPDVFKVLEDNAAKFEGKKIYLYPYGVGETEGEVSYIPDLAGSSRISERGTALAKIVALDDINFDKKVDFIKMDIEGAEERAINGAKTLIQKDHPILAISIYHNFSQFVNVVNMIKKLEPRYEIYIRHHRHTIHDTVCYAVYK